MEYLTQVIVPLFVALMGFSWYSQEKRKRKIDRYEKLISHLGLFFERPKIEQEKKIDDFYSFMNEYRVSFMYCSDEVIKNINAFFSILKTEASTHEDKQTALSNVIIEIRKDVYPISFKLFNNTTLTNKDFQHISCNFEQK